MKDESFLSAAGPAFITIALVGVLILSTWIMIRGQGDWGQPKPMAAAPAEAADH